MVLHNELNMIFLALEDGIPLALGLFMQTSL